MTFILQIGLGTASPSSIGPVDFVTGPIWTGHVSPTNTFAASGGTDAQFKSYTLITVRIAKRESLKRVLLGTGRNGMVRYIRAEVEALEKRRTV